MSMQGAQRQYSPAAGSQAIRQLVGWLSVALATTTLGIILARVGVPPGPPPAWPSPGDVAAALRGSEPPLEATRYVVSMMSWATVAYLAIILAGRAIVAAASARTEEAWVGTLDRTITMATLPPLRKLLGGSLAGVVLMTSAMRLTAIAAGPRLVQEQPPAVSESMVVLDGILAQSNRLAYMSQGAEQGQAPVAGDTATSGNAVQPEQAAIPASSQETAGGAAGGIGVTLPTASAASQGQSISTGAGQGWQAGASSQLHAIAAQDKAGGRSEANSQGITTASFPAPSGAALEPSAWSNQVQQAMTGIQWEEGLNIYRWLIGDSPYPDDIWILSHTPFNRLPPIPPPPAALDFTAWQHVYSALIWLAGPRSDGPYLEPVEYPVYHYIPISTGRGPMPGLDLLLALLGDWGHYNAAEKRIDVYMPGDVYRQVAAAPTPVQKLIELLPGRSALYPPRGQAITAVAQEWMERGWIRPASPGATIVGGPALKGGHDDETRLVFEVRKANGNRGWELATVTDRFWQEVGRQLTGMAPAAPSAGAAVSPVETPIPSAGAADPGAPGAAARPTLIQASSPDAAQTAPTGGPEAQQHAAPPSIPSGPVLEPSAWSSQIAGVVEKERAAFASSPLGRYIARYLGEEYVYTYGGINDPAHYWASNPVGIPIISRSWDVAPPPPPPSVDPAVWLNVVWALYDARSMAIAREAREEMQQAAAEGRLLGGPRPGQPTDALGFPILPPNTIETVHIECAIPKPPRGYSEWPGLAPLLDLFREWGARIETDGSQRYLVVDVPRSAWEAFQQSGDITQFLRQAPGWARFTGGR